MIKNKSLSFLLVIAIAAYFSSCTAEKKLQIIPNATLVQTIDNCLRDGALQYRLMIKNLPQDKFPKNYSSEQGLETSNSSWWCSGFYPGTLLYLYRQSNDQQLYNEAIRMLKIFRERKNNTTTHDLGFMMFCSFGEC